MASIVGSVEDVPAGRVVAFEVDGQSIAVANVEGTLFAFDDNCTHRGCSLAEGILAGTSITCLCHSSMFQVTDGTVIEGPAVKPLPTYAVEIVDGNIEVSASPASVQDASQVGSFAEKAAPESPPQAGGNQSTPEVGPELSGHDRVHSALASVPLFADLDQESIERLEAFAFRKTFPAGEIIVEEGHTGNGLYIVLSGTVHVIKGLRSPRPQQVAVLRVGEPFGEMALLGDWKRSASVQAIDEVECLGVDRWAFLTHLKNEPNLAIRMLQMLADRLVQTDSRLAE